MNDLDRLIAIEEIKQLKARYFRCIDTKAFEELRTVFADDAVFDARTALIDPVAGMPDGGADQEPAPEPVSGLDNIVAMISAALSEAQSAHHGHMPELEITSETTATGIWPMEDVVERGSLHFRGFGHYREEYEKIDGAWRIKYSLLTRLRVEIYSI